MFGQAGCDPWRTTLRQHLSHLRKPQATVLALWSFGMVLARSGALSAVSHLWATGMRRKEQTVRQQRRAWDDDVQRKRGAKRQAWRVETCCPLVLGWGVRGWHGTPLALALDATALGRRVVVLAVRGVYRGCAMPVAWVGLPANTQHAWRREGRRLLRRRRPAMPRGWTVLVLTDRGVSAPWRFRRIVRLGWQPFLRLNTGGTLRPAGPRCFRPLTRFAPQPGTRWRGQGTALQKAGRQVAGTLLGLWEDGDKAPWLRRTERPPAASAAAWYGRRAWMEQGCKIPKRAGGQWHRTRMTDPERAARRWLAVAGATLWGLRVGGAPAATIPARPVRAGTALCPGRPGPRRATRWRLVSGCRQGGVALLVALRRHDPLPQRRLVPAPWPAVPTWEAEARELESVLPEAAEDARGQQLERLETKRMHYQHV
jgi:hypothetical protein